MLETIMAGLFVPLLATAMFLLWYCLFGPVIDAFDRCTAAIERAPWIGRIAKIVRTMALILSIPFVVAGKLVEVLSRAIGTAIGYFDCVSARVRSLLLNLRPAVAQIIGFANKVTKKVYGFVSRYRQINMLPFPVLVAYEIVRRAVNIFVLALIAIRRLWYFVIPIGILVIFWWVFFYPYFLATEAYSQTVLEVTNMFTEAAGNLYNALAVTVNAIIQIIVNPLRPVLNTLMGFVAKSIKIFYNLTLQFITGTQTQQGKIYQIVPTDGYTIKTSAGSGVAAGARLLADNPDFVDPLAFTKGTEFNTYETVIATLIGIMQVVLDVVLMVVEVSLRVMLFFSDSVRFMIKVMETAVECMGNNIEAWFCFGWEIALTFIVSFWNTIATFIPILPKFSLEDSVLLCDANGLFGTGDIPCQCSSDEGGFFKNVDPCGAPNIQCVSSIKNGYTEYRLYVGEEVRKIGPNKAFVCGDMAIGRVDTLNRILTEHYQDKGVIDEDVLKTKCAQTCIHPPGIGEHGWYVRICPGDDKHYYMGSCKSETSGYKPLQDPFKVKEQVAKYKQYQKLEEVYFPEFGPPPPPVKDSGSALTLSSFKEAIKAIEALPLATTKFLCERVDELSFEGILYRTFCLYSRLSSDSKFSGAFKEAVMEIHNGAASANSKPRNLQEKKPKRVTYSGAFSRILTDVKGTSPDLESGAVLHPLTVLQRFRRKLTEAHTEHISTVYGTKSFFFSAEEDTSSLHPEHRRTFMDHMQTSIQLVNHQLSTTVMPQDELRAQKEKRRNLAADKSDATEDGSEEDPFKCGGIGTCPNPDLSCPVDGNLQEGCTQSDDITIVTVVVFIPYLINTGIKAISFNGILKLETLVQCWNYILDNPEAWPGSVDNVGYYIKNGVDREGVKYCFPMIPPLPTLPYFTWSLYETVTEICRHPLDSNINTCVCPVYINGDILRDTEQMWIKGINFATYGMLFNGLKNIQILLTPYTGWLSPTWVFIVSFFLDENTNKELWYALDYKTAIGPMTEAQVSRCLITHIGSTYFLIAFYIIPFMVIILTCYDLVYESMYLIFEPFVQVVVLFIKWLVFIGQTRSPELDEYERAKKQDIEVPAEPVNEYEEQLIHNIRVEDD